MIHIITKPLCLGWAPSLVKVMFGQNLTPDLANGGRESTWDHLIPVRKTLLFRTGQRRAHHLPHEGYILN